MTASTPVASEEQEYLLDGPTVPELLNAAGRRRGPDGYLTMHSRNSNADDPPTQLSLAALRQAVIDRQQQLRWLGIKRGDHVALALPNNIEHVTLIFALIGIRAVWVPVNPRLRGPSLSHQMAASNPQVIIISPEFTQLRHAFECDGLTDRIIPWDGNAALAPSASTLAAKQGAEPQDTPGPAHDDVVSIMYTSGTTGPPKGVQVTDRMLRASALGAGIASDIRPDSVYFLWEPLCHIGGAQVLLLPLIWPVRLAMVERFSASRFWRELAASGATHIHHLGGILTMLLNRPLEESHTHHRAKISWGGGMTPETWRQAEQRFGLRVRECYGLTEAASVTTVNPGDPTHGIGQALPYVEVQLRDENDDPTDDGSVGEIAIRSLTPGLITPGYLNDPEATKNAFRYGWWHTGDAGRFDETGQLHYLGRISDSVRHNGENVSAWEVETIVNTHPTIAESALVGVPNDAGEQDLMLYVTATPGQNVQEAVFLEWCRARLAPHQLPRYVAVTTELPKTPSQRVSKKDLRNDPSGCYDRCDQD